MEKLCNTSIPRLEKAIKLIDNVCSVSPGKFYVESDSEPNKYYEIYEGVLQCQCEDSSFRHLKCWHLYAVELYAKRKQNVAS